MKKNFYIVIIGSEILNGRREDKHFIFIRDLLLENGYEPFASFIIKDDRILIEKIYNQIKSDENSVMFSFGGIGATPDDLTREIASYIFTNEPPQIDEQFKKDIIERFGDEAYPHRINMANIPKGSKLLKNVINNMSGFYLDNRFFFVPGFPQMAQPMIKEAMNLYFPKIEAKHRKSVVAKTNESRLIDLMKQIPSHVELSSLPKFVDGNPNVELSISCDDADECESLFTFIVNELDLLKIEYEIIEIS